MHRLKIPILIALFATTATGAEYFSKPIDYWGGKKSAPKAESKKPTPKPPEPVNQTPSPVAKDEIKPFDWDKHVNPKNDEFFKEGDYTPPAPFMELARNPSDENIKRWFAMIESKNMLMARLQEKINAFMQKSGKSVGEKEKEAIAQQTTTLKPSSENTQRFRFRMYFDSTCPHCKHMMDTMKDLQDLGFYVEVKQIDKRPPNFPVPFPTTQATQEEIKEKQINSWPVLFIADVDKQQLYRINGYLPTNEVLTTLSKN